MLNFKSYVTEVFDKTYPYEVEHDYDGDIVYNFKTSDGKRGRIKCVFNEDEPDNWQIYFDINNRMDITGEGDAFVIFSTVISAIKHFIKEADPESIKFAAMKGEINPNSRSDLYTRMVSKMATGLGYTFRKEVVGKETNFIITKK
jgi:hypothetical protein